MTPAFEFVPSLTAQPFNFGKAETFSWIAFDQTSLPREFYARACYITNLSDLTFSLCAEDIRIGGVEIVDNESSLRCDVTSFTYEDGSYNALRVVNQDLDPELDTVSIADKNSNNVTVFAETSSLQVHLTNFTPLTSLLEQEFNETQTLLNSLTSLNQREFNETQTLLNSLTGLQDNKQSQIITLLHQLTANTDELEINTDGVETLLNSLTSLSVKEFDEIETLLNSLTAKDYATATNQTTIITLLNSLTSSEYSFNLNTDNIESLLSSANTLSVILTTSSNITNTHLSTLTSTSYEIINNQEIQNTLLNALTAKEYNVTLNVASIDLPTVKIETLLNSLTSLNQQEFNETQTFLDSLTGLQDNKQSQVITLLHQLTANTDELEINTDGVETLLNSLTSLNQKEFDETHTLLNNLTAKDYSTATNQYHILTAANNFYTNCITELTSLTALVTVLTGVDYSTATKQEKIITLLDALTAREYDFTLNAQEINLNTDNIEELLTATNTFLNTLTTLNYNEFNETQVLLNEITANQLTQITLEKTLTANSIFGTLSDTPLYVTVLNPVSSFSIVNQLTSVEVVNDVQVHATTTLPISGFVTVTNQTTGINVLNSIALKDLNGNNVTAVSSTSSLNVNVTNPVSVIVDPSVGFPVTFANSTNLDAFGRLRISTPLTLFDSSHRYRDNNLWSTLTAVNGEYIFNQNQGLIDLTVNNLSGSSVMRETVKVFSYQPGKSLLVMNTFVMAPSAHNLRQRVGYFGTDNGIYLQLDDEKISFVERSLVNGSPSIETIVPLSAWNGDRLDGSGPSKLTLDLIKAQIQWIDVEWLGVGTVRTGFVINGQFITCHSFHHANLLPATYITTASLPLRYEITNKDATTSSHTLKQICSTVISEGGYELRGLQQAISTPIDTPRTFASVNTYYPIVSVRLKTTPDRLDAIVILTALSVLGKGNGINYNWQVRASGITNGGEWISAGSDSAVEYNITGTSYTDGRILASGFLNSSNQGSPNLDVLKEALFKFQLERNSFTKTPYEITLVAAADTENGSGMFASMDWEEISR